MKNKNKNKVVNTSKEEVNLGWILGGDPESIEAQEARGQHQLVESDILPVEGSEGLEKIGFQLGDPIENDPIFRPAILPLGWTKKPAPNHSMWSYIYDEQGRKRAGVFYKAAFYDRRAFMNVTKRFNITYINVSDADNIGMKILDTANNDNIVFLSNVKTREDEELWKSTQINHNKCVDWLKEHYPEYEDPFAYWE